MTGRPALALLHMGPGLANALSGAPGSARVIREVPGLGGPGELTRAHIGECPSQLVFFHIEHGISWFWSPRPRPRTWAQGPRPGECTVRCGGRGAARCSATWGRLRVGRRREALLHAPAVHVLARSVGYPSLVGRRRLFSPGLHNAHRAGTPLLALVGDFATFHRGVESMLAMDIAGSAKTVAKVSWCSRRGCPSPGSPTWL